MSVCPWRARQLQSSITCHRPATPGFTPPAVHTAASMSAPRPQHGAAAALPADSCNVSTCLCGFRSAAFSCCDVLSPCLCPCHVPCPCHARVHGQLQLQQTRSSSSSRHDSQTADKSPRQCLGSCLNLSHQAAQMRTPTSVLLCTSSDETASNK
jgi:hypothetical protein